MNINTKSEITKRLYLRDWNYSDKDIPTLKTVSSPTALKKFEEFTKDDKLSILSDRVFKAMFYDDKRLKHAAKMISEFINISYEDALNNIKLLKNEINIKCAGSKKFIADFVAEIYDNLINMEMNNKNEIERNIIYLDKLIDRKNEKGKELELPQAGFQLNFCDFGLENNNKCFEIYELQSKNQKLLTFDKQIMLIFLQNIWKKYYNGDELTYRERMILVHVATKKSIAKDIAKGDEYLMEIIKDLEELETNSDLIEAYDHESSYAEARYIRGHEEGREEGREEEKIDIAKNLLKLKTPIDIIIQATNLSKKTIVSLKSTIL